jgi:hypothetical protein
MMPREIISDLRNAIEHLEEAKKEISRILESQNVNLIAKYGERTLQYYQCIVGTALKGITKIGEPPHRHTCSEVHTYSVRIKGGIPIEADF